MTTTKLVFSKISFKYWVDTQGNSEELTSNLEKIKMNMSRSRKKLVGVTL